jgi:hypothetical protein
VVGADTLEQGRAWARATLGIEPLTGGRHAFMGTHNLVARLDDPRARELYLEILAVDPQARDPGRPRWFDLDDPDVRAALADEPRLLAWVARSDDLEGDLVRLLAAGVDPGPVFAAERGTPTGTVRWRITIPADGARLAGGAVPALIAWDTPSPARSLPPSGVGLEGIDVRVSDGALARLLETAGARVAHGTGPALEATIRSSVGARGTVRFDAVGP